MAVPTENEIQRCDAAWDYIGICAEVGINPNRTHRAWIEKRAISSADWLLWLFAVKVPAGKFVVNDSLKRLREERSIDAFCRAAKIHRNSHLNWTSNPNTKAALEAAIRTFTGAGNRNALPDPKEFEGLQARTRAAMKKYALATALKTCIERAGFREQYFNETFREAKRLKLDESITNFLDWKKPFHLPWYESGEVSLNFFVPTNDMIRFQKTACKRWQSGKLWDLRNRLPHFDQWFQDVALGRQFQGERLGFHHHRNGTKEGLDQNAIGSQILQVDKLVVNAHKAEVHSGHKMKRRNIRKAKPSLPVSMPTIGRPKGTTDVGAWKRRKAILADHKSGKFPTIVELAAHYSISRGRASNIIHGRR
jgi:hypothetical protein